MIHYGVFSEAIREGAKLRPQAFGELVEGAGTGKVSTCAYAAGYEAITGEVFWVEKQLYDAVERLFPYMGQDAPVCPVGDCEERPVVDDEWDVGDLLIHLNDDHQWTREEIADWLSDEEEKLGFVLLSEEETDSASPVREPHGQASELAHCVR